MPAKQVQSSRLPASARQCIVNLSAQTLRVKSSSTIRLCSRWIERLFTRSPARIHSDSLSTASLRRKTLSSIRAIVTSSSDGLFPKRKMSVKKYEIKVDNAHTYRPTSYSLDAMGEISEWIVIVPSNGRSGVGLTIFAETYARTLEANEPEVNNL